MKMIVISEEAFNKLFEEALKDLELDELKARLEGTRLDAWQTGALNDLHRKFHYEVCCLKERIVRG